MFLCCTIDSPRECRCHSILSHDFIGNPSRTRAPLWDARIGKIYALMSLVAFNGVLVANARTMMEDYDGHSLRRATSKEEAKFGFTRDRGLFIFGKKPSTHVVVPLYIVSSNNSTCYAESSRRRTSVDCFRLDWLWEAQHVFENTGIHEHNAPVYAEEFVFCN